MTNSDGVAETDNLEHLNCTDGNRVSHWRINNGGHNPLLNDQEWPYHTLAWALEDFSRDSDGDGYRIGCVTGAADVSGLTTWDVTDVTEAEALTHCQAVDSRTYLRDDGLFQANDVPEHVAE